MSTLLHGPEWVRAMAGAALDALNAHICIIAGDGTIITVNHAWRTFAEANGAVPEAVSEGANYLRVCDKAAGAGAEDARAMAAGIRAVVNGAYPEFSLEYACHSTTQKRWYIGRVTRLAWEGETYSVIAHENITVRRLTEEALHTSQFMLAEAERLAHTGAWEIDFDAEIGKFSKEWQIIHGTSKSTMSLKELYALVHPYDLAAVLQTVNRARAVHGQFDLELCIRKRDTGEERTMRVVGEFFPGATGKHDRAIGVSIDITERRRGERERENYLSQLRALSDNLQRAGENERTWIAREIHDEFGQSLTRLSFDISLLKKQIWKDQAAAFLYCESIEEMIEELIKSVQKISAKLRPALLDEFGLTEAMKWQIRDFQAHSSIECSFTIMDDMPEVEPATATAFFRILQEALTNIQRHAEARKAFVRFYRDDHAIILEVEDNGVGVSEEKLSNPSSIGIIGMKERARSAGGSFTVASEPGKFTWITVRIPISGSIDSINEESNYDEDTDR